MNNKEFKKFFDQQVESFRRLNPNKLIKPSKFFNQIGSTSLEDLDYKDELMLKEKALKELFPLYSKNLDIQIYPSPIRDSYRFKVEFVTANNLKFEPHNRFGQRKKNNFSWVVNLDEYILLNKSTFKLVKDVFDYAIELDIPLFNFNTNLGLLRYLTVKGIDTELMVIITVTDESDLINQLAEFAINRGFKSVYIVKNNTLSDSSEGETLQYFGQQYLNIEFKDRIFKVGPDTFFQNNLLGFKLIIDYLESFLNKNNLKDKFNLYDLYCGIGFIGITLADYFNKIIGVELVKESIDLANINKEVNKITNIEFINSDLNTLKQSFLKDSVIMVDPPRVGLEQSVDNLLESGAKYIFYISCNPVSLKSDLIKLTEKYNLIDLKFFDCFPLTPHIEGLAILQIKN